MAKKKKGKFKISTPLAIVGGVVVVGLVIGLPIYNMSRRIYVNKVRGKIQSLTAIGADILLSVDIKNASSVSLPVDAVAGQISWGPYLMAVIGSEQRFSIDAGKISSVDFVININWSALGNNLVAMIRKGNWMQQLNFKGSIVVKGIRVPINQNIQIL